MTFEEYDESLEKCKEEIVKHVREIVKILHDCSPECRYLSISYIDDVILINNAFWEVDKDKPIDMFVGSTEEEKED